MNYDITVADNHNFFANTILVHNCMGIDITNKIRYMKFIPSNIKIKDEIHIRGELVILNADIQNSETNLRNVCAGFVNKKTINTAELSKISFIPYTILGDKYTKTQQFNILNENGFITAYNIEIDKNTNNLSEYLTMVAKKEHEYSCDGLVLTDSESYNEVHLYRPKNTMAFKINELNAISRIIDISWEGPSKDGRIQPIFIIEPVEIGGSVISRVSAHNIEVINNIGVKIGSVVEINKANDIIPHVTKVIKNDENTINFQIPKTCNCCGSELVKEGPFIYCKNKNCIGQTTYQVMHFIKRLGIDFASYKTLNNFGIHTFDDLLNFRANLMSKNEMKLEDQLKSKMFNKSEIEIFCAINMKDIAEKTLRKIIEHYGWENIKNNSIDSDTFTNLPIGIGDLTMNKFISCYKDNLIILNKIISDTRYIGNNDFSEKESTNIEIKGSVCITGPVYHFKNREEFLKMAEDFGYESKSGVSKGLTYLINNDINSTSSKNKKAKSLGIPIISEEDFMKIVGYYKFTPDGL